MAHTILLNGCCKTIGNADWSGDITLRFPQDAVATEENRKELQPFLKEDGSYSVPVPGFLLKGIAAEIVRSTRIARLEPADDDDLLSGKV